MSELDSSLRVVLIGATGTVGKATHRKLENSGFTVIPVSYSGNDTAYTVDIQDTKSIEDLFKKIGKFDALVSTTGKATFKDIKDLTEEDWHFSINNKLLGQIHLVQIGAKYISKGGSFTLTSGILNVEPIAKGTIAAVVNSGLEGYIKSASIEYTGYRINIVSPTVVTESIGTYGPFFVGFESVSVEKVANGYLKSVSGIANGSIIKIGF